MTTAGCWGPSCWPPTSGSVMAFLGDTHGLGDHGEVMVGVEERRIASTSPCRPAAIPDLAEVSAEEFPSLDAATSGDYGFTPTTDYRGRDVLVAYRPLGLGYPNWGLIAKVDTDEAYEPVARLRRLLLALGGGLLALGLGASNAIARRFARPIKRLARTSAAVAAGDLTVRSEVTSSDEIGGLGLAFNRMTEELERSYADLERRIAERTHALESVRDLLDAFFRIFTSRMDPDNIDKTFDTVLRFCSDLGYDLAMISLVDREAGVIRAVRASGSMAGLIVLTVRPLDGGDILAIAAREGRAIVVPDAMADPRCDAEAAAVAGIHGLVVLPMVSDGVLGTLQVATRSDAGPGPPRPPPAGDPGLAHRPRPGGAPPARGDPPAQPEPPGARAGAGALRAGAARADPHPPVGPRLHGRRGRRRRRRRGGSWSSTRRRTGSSATAGSRCDARASGPAITRSTCPIGSRRIPRSELPLMRAMRGESVDQAELYIAYPSREDGTWITVTGRPLRDEGGTTEGGVVVFHDVTRRKKAERRLAAQYATTRVLAEADSLGQAGPRILETIGTSLDWDLGVLWRVDPRAHRLQVRDDLEPAGPGPRPGSRP